MSSPPITSLQNQRVKDAAKLRERRQRDKQHRILIDGVRELRRAITAGVALREIFVCEPLCRTVEARRLLDSLDSCGAEILPVTPEVFAKLAFGDRAEGVLGVARTPAARLDDLKPPSGALVAVVEGVEKPGNLGAVLRSADAAGVSALIAAGHGVDLFSPNVIRASLGTVFTLPVAAASAEETKRWLAERSFRVFAARVDAERLYTDVSYAGDAAIVLGSEAAGLSDIWSGPDVTPVKLPMCGAADSLNISAAAAVIFYEALRQRQSR
ncbi:MAG TPA: TrmH family RNA methyltransferase [Pirellulales bacterium]|nr:TrmH family RNA methyltransferase [Pirellulales bacterium]